MSLTFPMPHPLRITNPALFFSEYILGLVFVLALTLFADLAGTAMFRRGFAKPFYILGHRIHHNCIYTIVPVSYSVLSVLFLLGYVKIQWATFYDNLAIAGIIAILAMVTDFLWDRYVPHLRINGVIHHEWIYTLVPAYMFTYVVHLAF